MVEKFQLLQTAHEVLSDPSKRATYDRTRGATGRATAAYTRTSTTTTTTSTPKNRFGRQSTGTNGFSKATPNAGKPPFGYFTTREPPSSPGTRKTGPTPGSGAARSPPQAHPTGGFAKATRPGTTRTTPQKDKPDAYFGRFREKPTTSSTSSTAWQQFSSAHTPRATPQFKAQQRKEEAQKTAGVKTPKRSGPTKFGTTFQPVSDEELESEEDTFFSFSSNGGSFNGTESNKKEQQSWSERRSAYSHVFTGVKEDMRSPSKPKPAPQTAGFAFETKSTGFASDGFKFPPKAVETNGLGAGFAKSTTKTSNAPPLFANGPARRKSSQTRSSSNSTTPLTESNEVPKTPPPVEERRFASAFSRLNVNTSPNKVPPTKPTSKINIDDWTKKFEGMNPFMTPDTKKLSEDPKFWSSVPLKATPTPARRVPLRGIKVKRGGGGLGDMSDMKKELPKTDCGGIKLNGVGVAPVSATFNVDVPNVQQPPSSGVPPTPSRMFGGIPTSPGKPSTPLDPTQQQPTPAATPLFNPPSHHPNSPPRPTHHDIPELYPPTPPKQLIPHPSSPQEFSFSVPSKAEMQSLAGEVQAYHIAYIAERYRFEEALKAYEEHINFTDEQIVRTYLKVKEELILTRTEMEALHTLCLERWGSVAKFAGFTG